MSCGVTMNHHWPEKPPLWSRWRSKVEALKGECCTLHSTVFSPACLFFGGLDCTVDAVCGSRHCFSTLYSRWIPSPAWWLWLVSCWWVQHQVNDTHSDGSQTINLLWDSPHAQGIAHDWINDYARQRATKEMKKCFLHHKGMCILSKPYLHKKTR